MKALLCCLATLAGVSFMPPVSAIEVRVEIPHGFALRTTGNRDTVVYAASVGERVNPFDRSTIESQCEIARALGQTRLHPLFEAGYDQPLKTENWRFSTSRRSVELSVLHAYGCDQPPPRTPDSANYACGCTYRVHLQRDMHIRKQEDGRVETITIDVSRGTGRRYVAADHSVPEPNRAERLVTGLAPEVVGHDTVAGIPCVIRRQHIGSAWTDRCIAEDPEQHLAPFLRFSALSETTTQLNGQGVYSWVKTVRVVPEASVDNGVFEVPEGITLQGDAR